MLSRIAGPDKKRKVKNEERKMKNGDGG